jgi:cobalt-zinc-cadmium efflux system protein
VSAEIRRYWLVLGIAILIFIIEITGGIISNSLALLSDAGHILADTTAIIISLIIAYTVNKNPSKEKTIRSIGAYLNTGILGLLSILIFLEAIKRFQSPAEIMNNVMFWCAVAGTVLNYIQHRILETAGHEEHHLTHQAINWHVLSDFWQSVAVVFASMLIALTGKTIIDPILSVAVSAVMAYWTIKLFWANYKS